MSHHATNWAIRQRGLKPAAKIVLWHLCDRHNPDYGCFPSQKTLANDCEMSERSVRDQLNTLEAAGLVVRQHSKTREGQFGSDRYFLAFEADFPQRQNLPTANPASGKNASSPAANSRQNQRQNLPPNPVREPLRETVNTPVVPKPDEPPVKARLPADWALDDEGLEYARSLQLHDPEIQEIANDFHTYWTDRTDAGGKKSQRGWAQAWRNQCLRVAPTFKRNRGMAGNAGPARYGQGGSLASIAARRRADGSV